MRKHNGRKQKSHISYKAEARHEVPNDNTAYHARRGEKDLLAGCNHRFRDEPRIVRIKPVLIAHSAHEIDIVIDSYSHPNCRNRKGVYIQTNIHEIHDCCSQEIGHIWDQDKEKTSCKRAINKRSDYEDYQRDQGHRQRFEAPDNLVVWSLQKVAYSLPTNFILKYFSNLKKYNITTKIQKSI